MKTLIRLLVITTALIIGSKSFAQLSISFYSSSLSKIGLAYNITDRWWIESRFLSNTSIGDISPELVVCFNLVKKDRHAVYIGAGAIINYFNGPVLPVGVQFTPFEKFNRFSLHIEFEPMLDLDNDFILQSSWGLRYKFGEKE
ncbi:MAG: hypothetical protein JXK95_02940 [Bacteroidales bacterium]|nr:hypothetical protein [Bacteroidales bacterium]